MPMALTFSERLERLAGSFSRFTYQSPRPELSSFRFPNQPSSRTSISMPRSAACDAIFKIFSSSKLKYVAFQLLIRMGRLAYLYFPLQIWSLMILWKLWDSCVKPLPE